MGSGLYPDDDPKLLQLQYEAGKRRAVDLAYLLGLLCEECARNLATRDIYEHCPYPHQQERYIEGWMEAYKTLPRLQVKPGT